MSLNSDATVPGDDEFATAIEGAEDVTFVEVEDRSGDAYYDEKEEMPVGGLVIIIFVVGAFVAGAIFYLMYRCERYRREQEQAKKLGSVNNGSSANMRSSSTPPGTPSSAGSGK